MSGKDSDPILLVLNYARGSNLYLCMISNDVSFVCLLFCFLFCFVVVVVVFVIFVVVVVVFFFCSLSFSQGSLDFPCSMKRNPVIPFPDSGIIGS